MCDLAHAASKASSVAQFVIASPRMSIVVGSNPTQGSQLVMYYLGLTLCTPQDNDHDVRTRTGAVTVTQSQWSKPLQLCGELHTRTCTSTMYIYIYIVIHCLMNG